MKNLNCESALSLILAAGAVGKLSQNATGAVGKLLGDQPITSQNANGAVFVALSTAPVLIRANFSDARIWGIEYTLGLAWGIEGPGRSVTARYRFRF